MADDPVTRTDYIRLEKAIEKLETRFWAAIIAALLALGGFVLDRVPESAPGPTPVEVVAGAIRYYLGM